MKHQIKLLLLLFLVIELHIMVESMNVIHPYTNITMKRYTRSTCGCKLDECCSKWGFCGRTEEHCGSGCVSGPCNTTNYTKPCDCKPGECCSKYGICGTTKDHCGLGCRSGCNITNYTTSCSCKLHECCSEWYNCGTTYGYCGPGCRSGPCTNSTSTNIFQKYSRLSAILASIFGLLLLIMFILFLIGAYKYRKMLIETKKSIFKQQTPTDLEDTTQPPISQLTRIRLPDNFASTQQIRTLLGYVNKIMTPLSPDNFKELGKGQFGVVYQVRLPEVDLVAAKLLPESIRNVGRQPDKRKKNYYTETNDYNSDTTPEQEAVKKKAAEMLIDEIKIMHRVGKHFNIVSLKKVAYPEAKLKYLFTGGPIREEDSFYLMELCSNGSLEVMLKLFDQSLPPTSTMSLYETLAKQAIKTDITMEQARYQCTLTDDDLKFIAYQVASGVDYLNRKQIVHSDIAPRNVLVNSRFVMKICDFGLAAWITYKDYQEQLAQNESVKLEKNSENLAVHNLTPEIARALLDNSSSDRHTRILKKSSMKSDTWSFGIFLWSLFLKCRIRPFAKIHEEMKRTPSDSNLFQHILRAVAEGRVLHYISYQPEIPRRIYAIIRDCLADEDGRPEMKRIRSVLSHSKMLSKQAFQYYRDEYNRYQYENSTEDNIETFPDDQPTDIPDYNDDNSGSKNGATPIITTDDSQETTVNDMNAETAPLISPQRNTGDQNVPRANIRGQASLKPARPPSTTSTVQHSPRDSYA